MACQLLQRTDTLQSANYVRTELPVRIAHRLRDLQALPYVVVTQEGVAKVYEVGNADLPPTSILTQYMIALLVGIREVSTSVETSGMVAHDFPYLDSDGTPKLKHSQTTMHSVYS